MTQSMSTSPERIETWHGDKQVLQQVEALARTIPQVEQVHWVNEALEITISPEFSLDQLDAILNPLIGAY